MGIGSKLKNAAGIGNPFGGGGLKGLAGRLGLGGGIRRLTRVKSGETPLPSPTGGMTTASQIIATDKELAGKVADTGRDVLSAEIAAAKDVGSATVATTKDAASLANEMRKDEMKVAGDVLMDTAKVLGIMKEPPAPPKFEEPVAPAFNVAVGTNNLPNIKAGGFADIAQGAINSERRKRGKSLATTLGVQ